MKSRRRLCSAGWESMVLSSVLLLHFASLCVNGSSFISNSTGTNSSDLNGNGLKLALPITRTHVHSQKPRAGEESGSLGETSSSAVRDSSFEREHVIDLTIDGMAARLPTLAEPRTRGLSQLDFNEERTEDSAPRWKSERLQADGTFIDPVTSPSPESTPSQPEEVIKVNFYNPSYQQSVPDPPAWVQELQGSFYDYLSPDYSPTEVYLEESQPLPPDMEDENVPLIASTVPSNARVITLDDGSGESSAGASDVLTSGCLYGFVRYNGTCISSCDIFPSYCFNGGQCYVVDSIGAFCRCNIQEYIWNKGSRCESVISDFQVMCIAVGGAAVMLLLLFMVIVVFSKRMHVLKTENRRLRKHSKFRPKSEQHIDNFSLSTVAEGSQANKTMTRYTWEYKPKEDPCSEDCTCKEEPCKCPPKEDESLKNQNSLMPKLEDDKAATEDNAEEGGVTIDLELLLPKEAKMLPETSPPLHYNVFLYKHPKSPKKSPVLRLPPGRSVQGRPVSQLFPRRSSEPSYCPISTRSLPGVLSGSSSPHLGTDYTP
ncbi:chondroitin sulfate proteoglycan 5-like isoform X3 [Carassius gibelio]|uniref:chondroitin sulfate proteoglycan 5-like isoform X3 n=1 Tax=Carassius gibelio TaxID=101364 RepID=UPI002278C478|nr:chondroitin sulfate proteoglycan 5-like isoform X3 [Carassius gibelio]